MRAILEFAAGYATFPPKKMSETYSRTLKRTFI